MVMSHMWWVKLYITVLTLFEFHPKIVPCLVIMLGFLCSEKPDSHYIRLKLFLSYVMGLNLKTLFAI